MSVMSSIKVGFVVEAELARARTPCDDSPIGKGAPVYRNVAPLIVYGLVVRFMRGGAGICACEIMYPRLIRVC